MADTITVRAGWSLIDDWDTRGLLVDMIATRSTVAGSRDQIAGLVFDCELQTGQSMEPSPGFRRACLTFIDRARVALG